MDKEKNYFEDLLVEIPKRLELLKIMDAPDDIREACLDGRLSADEIKEDTIDVILDAFRLANESKDETDIEYAFTILGYNFTYVLEFNR